MSATTDKVPVVCPKCNKRLLVPSGTLGKQGRCPACQTVFTLEQLWEAESVPAASPFGGSTGFAPATNQWGQPAATAASPYSDDDFQGDYQLQSAPPAPAVNPYSSPQFTPVSTGAYSGSYKRKEEAGFWNGSVMGGLALMAIAVVWFFGGLAVGFIFFYPPIMFIIGLFVFFKGLFAGNLSGE